ncbi:hypothetical protein N7532_001053 [Penicillium argentinense]|uniref:Uncharacterized protein n=1 Tax=Penicillium argentinense TaxID=1131581 RepID=A0A9W9KM26_9EURO|nr:uncharacterized protein N7532_001053 [Penicillium argentinense]KAJ5110518.1 hypothetical protein N7532_001053 [Penicillium argentinense]
MSNFPYFNQVAYRQYRVISHPSPSSHTCLIYQSVPPPTIYPFSPSSNLLLSSTPHPSQQPFERSNIVHETSSAFDQLFLPPYPHGEMTHALKTFAILSTPFAIGRAARTYKDHPSRACYINEKDVMVHHAERQESSPTLNPSGIWLTPRTEHEQFSTYAFFLLKHIVGKPTHIMQTALLGPGVSVTQTSWYFTLSGKGVYLPTTRGSLRESADPRYGKSIAFDQLILPPIRAMIWRAASGSLRRLQLASQLEKLQGIPQRPSTLVIEKPLHTTRNVK